MQGRFIPLVMMLVGGTLAARPACGAVQYDPILEWTGPYFRVINKPAVDQTVDSPVIGSAFSQPFAVAAREHSTGGRDVVYALDTDHSRVQLFEVNAVYQYRNQSAFTWQATVTAAAQWDDDEIQLPEWAASASKFAIPYSELVRIEGVTWTWVANLTGFTAADRVYTIDYADATNAPEILFPTGSLAATTTFTLNYATSDEQTGASAAFGIGDVDYGIGAGAAPVLTTIDESSGGPTSWQTARSVTVAENEATTTSDDVFILDTDDDSVAQDEGLFLFTVTDAGTATYQEAYDDVTTQPYDVAVARSGTSTAATVSVSSDAGPFDQATASVIDASEVTGHIYDVTVSVLNVTITDRTTGRVLVSSTTFTTLANPFRGIPGLSFNLNAVVGSSIVVTTTTPVSGRYLFLTDTGADRIKVVAAGDGAAASWPGDWFPGDFHAMTAQPTGLGSVGTPADTDYRYTTPATVPEDYAIFTNAFPIKEGSLETITADPGGTPVTWTRVDDLSTQTPTAKVYQLDWTRGRIVFGDGIHGLIPPANTQLQFFYTTTVDVLRYGSLGDGDGQFNKPKGIVARWNAALGVYDVYVCDTGNDRMQKFAFVPANPSQNLPARIDFVCAFKTVSSPTDPLNDPVDVAVMADGASPAVVWLAVSDQGSNRIVLYRDTAAGGAGGATAPTWEATLGSSGTTLGKYQKVQGLSFLPNGIDLDLYATDTIRNVIVKYEKAPTPTVTLNFTGASVLPACFANTDAYPYSFTTQNPPSGGYIDFYYDTASSWSSGTSKLCFTSGSIPATAASAVWNFDQTPTGTPADGSAYYLFARLKDSGGNVVALDQTTASELLCVSSELLPGLAALDAVDGDRTVAFQNGSSRTVNLAISNPDSIISAGFSGTFDATALEITGITQGNAWDGTGATAVIWNQTYSNTAGTFTVSSSAVGAPIGLVTPGPHNVAQIVFHTKSGVLTPSARVKDTVIAISKTTSTLRDIHNAPPSTWRAPSLKAKLAYLGDLATNGSGADSTLPHLGPKPDGKINFEDQMVFTAGWNGVDLERDRIADLGPVEGVTPDLVSDPDDVWNVEDVLAFTVMYSWAGAGGYQRPLDGGWMRSNASRPELIGTPIAGAMKPRIVTSIANPEPGARLALALAIEDADGLCGALFHLRFDPEQLTPAAIEDTHWLEGGEGGFFFRRAGEDWIEISASRLDREAPGVHGDGVVAELAFEILASGPSSLELDYDLRGARGEVLSRGSIEASPFVGSVTTLRLLPPAPNPSFGPTTLTLALPARGLVDVSIFDAGGRRIRRLTDERLESGWHVLPFDGRCGSGRPLAPGLYLVRAESASGTRTQKFIVR